MPRRYSKKRGRYTSKPKYKRSRKSASVTSAGFLRVVKPKLSKKEYWNKKRNSAAKAFVELERRAHKSMRRDLLNKTVAPRLATSLQTVAREFNLKANGRSAGDNAGHVYGLGMYTGAHTMGDGMYTGDGAYLPPWASRGLDGLAAGASAMAPEFSGLIGAGRAGLRAVGLGDYSVNVSPNINGGKSFTHTGDFVPPRIGNPTSLEPDTGLVQFSKAELVGEIFAPGTIFEPGTATTGSKFEVQEWNLNAGLRSTFPSLAPLAANFNEYAFKGLIFSYKPLNVKGAVAAAGVVDSGRVIFQWRPSTKPEDAPTSFSQIRDNKIDHVENETTSGLMLGIECDPGKMRDSTNIEGYKKVRWQGVSADEDLDEIDYGVLSIATEGIPQVRAGRAIGELYVSYKCCLRYPQANQGSGKTILTDAFVYERSAPGSIPVPLGRPARCAPTVDADAEVDLSAPAPRVPNLVLTTVLEPQALFPSRGSEDPTSVFASVNNGINARIRCMPQGSEEMMELVFPTCLENPDINVTKIDEVNAIKLELLDEWRDVQTVPVGFQNDGTKPTIVPSFDFSDKNWMAAMGYAGSRSDAAQRNLVSHYLSHMSFIEVTTPANFTGDVDFKYSNRTSEKAIACSWFADPVGMGIAPAASRRVIDAKSTAQIPFGRCPTSVDSSLSTANHWRGNTWSTLAGKADTWFPRLLPAHMSVGSVVLFRRVGAKITPVTDLLNCTSTTGDETQHPDTTDAAIGAFAPGSVNTSCVHGRRIVLPASLVESGITVDDLFDPSVDEGETLSALATGGGPTDLSRTRDQWLHIVTGGDSPSNIGNIGYEMGCRVHIDRAPGGTDNTFYIGMCVSNPAQLFNLQGGTSDLEMVPLYPDPLDPTKAVTSPLPLNAAITGYNPATSASVTARPAELSHWNARAPYIEQAVCELNMFNNKLDDGRGESFESLRGKTISATHEDAIKSGISIVVPQPEGAAIALLKQRIQDLEDGE